MSIVDTPTHRWTVEEYERLGEGFFGDRRVELLNGEIVEMSPVGYRHLLAVRRLSKRFTLKANDRYEVQVHGPFELDADSVPEPDVLLVDNITDQLPHLPRTAHVYLAIEVSDTSLRYDRGDKRSAYALQGVPEYWILNLQENVMEVYRAPEGDRYGSVATLGAEQFASPLAFPDLQLRVGDFIP